MQALAVRLAVVNFGTLQDKLDKAKEGRHSLTELEVEELFKSLPKVKV